MIQNFSLAHSLRLIAWNIRRELWENRAVFLAPLTVAVLEVVGAISSLRHAHSDLSMIEQLDPAERAFGMAATYGGFALPIIATSVIVGIFYSLDALYAERRDRSVLFWKSLPVSDRLTVLSKALIPMAVLPAVAFLLVSVTQLAVLGFSAAMFSLGGVSLTILWQAVPVAVMPIAVAYALITMALWHAPLYGWLFLVGSFARRANFLMAVLPLFAIAVLEYFSLGSARFLHWLSYRGTGNMMEAFNIEGRHDLAITRLSQLDPARFLTSEGLWTGLVLAALFFFAATHLRRSREMG